MASGAAAAGAPTLASLLSVAASASVSASPRWAGVVAARSVTLGEGGASLSAATASALRVERTSMAAKALLAAAPRGVYSGMRTARGRRAVLAWEQHVGRVALGAHTLFAGTSTVEGTAAVSAASGESGGSGGKSALHRDVDVAMRAVVGAALQRFHVDVAEHGDAAFGVPEGAAEVKCLVVLTQTAEDIAAAAAEGGGNSDTSPSPAEKAVPMSSSPSSSPPSPSPTVVPLTLFAHVGVLDAHPETGHVEVRGDPRSNPSVKDIQWAKERTTLSARAAPGVNEVLLSTGVPDGGITEGLLSNFAALSADGTLLTAPEDLVLPGTIRALMLEACQEHGVPVDTSGPPPLSDVDAWQGAAVMSTSRLVLPVRRIDVYDSADATQPSHSRTFDPAVPPLLQSLCDWTRQAVDRHSTLLVPQEGDSGTADADATG